MRTQGCSGCSLFSAADKKKTYCLYEAPNAEAIREAARRLNIPADVIIEVDSVITGDPDLLSLPPTGVKAMRP